MKKPLAPVAITGMGCLCAAGLTVEACMDFLFRGERFPARPSRFSTDPGAGFPVFEVKSGFWSAERFRFSPRCRTVRLALTAAHEALAQAGLERDLLKKKRVGVCIGSNVAGSVSNPELFGPSEFWDGGYPTSGRRFAAANPAVGLAREFDLTGPVETVVTACSAGTDAIGLGAAWIRMGLCDAVLVGGADELYEITYNGFISLMNSDEGPCRPFDVNRRGLNLGEGAAVLVLESEELLRERAAICRGRVLGYGAAGDAYHLTAPDPDGQGLRLALQEALASSGIAPDALAFINAHGTGTPDNDRIESRVFDAVFPKIPFLSTKGYTGHTLGAAGAVEAVFSLGCLSFGQVPPSVGFADPDPELPAHPVLQTTPVTGSAAMSETLAFGGNNAVLILGKDE
ncbi:MAG: beta-ketoacyl-[acyl-carrier-protein] synthase family protein [Desulfobacterales bacterium]|nr:beta-ketoacyl-[acyl-carrier-protein] synthase family protein [Desulfobacterales bacterium]